MLPSLDNRGSVGYVRAGGVTVICETDSNVCKKHVALENIHSIFLANSSLKGNVYFKSCWQLALEAHEYKM